MTDDRQAENEQRRLSVWQVIKSTAAAAFGVQTEDARRRDFTQGSAASFIIAGLLFTVAFVVGLLVVVNLVLSQAG